MFKGEKVRSKSINEQNAKIIKTSSGDEIAIETKDLNTGTGFP